MHCLLGALLEGKEREERRSSCCRWFEGTPPTKKYWLGALLGKSSAAVLGSKAPTRRWGRSRVLAFSTPRSQIHSIATSSLGVMRTYQPARCELHLAFRALPSTIAAKCGKDVAFAAPSAVNPGDLKSWRYCLYRTRGPFLYSSTESRSRSYADPVLPVYITCQISIFKCVFFVAA